MGIKAGWTVAIAVALIVTAAPQLRARELQARPVGSSCNPWEGDLAIVEVDNRPVRNYTELRDGLGKLHPRDTMYLTVRQVLPTVGSKTIKIAFRVGDASQTVSSSSTIAAENTPQSEDYYEMISGCVNCVIPGIELVGIRVQLLVSQDDSVVPPVKRGLFTVTAPTKNSFADRSGVRYADQIVKINGEPVSSMSLMEAIERLRGARAAGATLTMARTVGQDELYTLTLPRR